MEEWEEEIEEPTKDGHANLEDSLASAFVHSIRSNMFSIVLLHSAWFLSSGFTAICSQKKEPKGTK